MVKRTFKYAVIALLSVSLVMLWAGGMMFVDWQARQINALVHILSHH